MVSATACPTGAGAKLLWFSGRHLELANAVAVIEVD
jgi:hypothetical protein